MHMTPPQQGRELIELMRGPLPHGRGTLRDRFDAAAAELERLYAKLGVMKEALAGLVFECRACLKDHTLDPQRTLGQALSSAEAALNLSEDGR